MEKFGQYNPRFSSMQQGIDLCKKEKCDFTMAVKYGPIGNYKKLYQADVETILRASL